jgi:hypothetical protein
VLKKAPPAYSFGLKPPLQNHMFVPGPGAYNSHGSFVRIPGSKIGTSTRGEDSRPQSPGPGAYKINTLLAHAATKNDAPHYKIGTETRGSHASLGKVVSPGPGAYNHRLSVGFDGQKRSLTSRRPESAPSFRNCPGPGSYTPNRNSSSKVMPLFSIGNGQRGKLGLNSNKSVPGPGVYSPNLATLKK